MTVETWVQAGLAVVGSVGGVVAARSARRTKRQENRDDFTTIVKELRTDLTSVKEELAEQKTESRRQAEQITDQALALHWLQTRLQHLVSYIRGAGMEPPAAAPIPERARKYIHHIDV